MKKFERIHLHIGLHKTGTSSLQNFLFEQRDFLRRELGILYPSIQRNHSQPLFSLFSSHSVRYAPNIHSGVDTRERVDSFNRESRKALENEFRTSGARQLILSGEDLSDLNADGHCRLRDWLTEWGEEIRVVCVLRNPVTWSISAAQSQIRGGKTYADVNENPPLPRLRTRLEACTESYGPDALYLIDFDEALRHAHGLTGSLFERLQLPVGWLEGKFLERNNESMTQEAAHLISALNLDRPLVKDGKLGESRFRGDINEIVLDTAGQPFCLGASALQQIEAQSRDDLAWLEETFDLHLDVTVPSALENDGECIPFSREAISSLALQMHDRARLRRSYGKVSRKLGEAGEQVAKLVAKQNDSDREEAVFWEALEVAKNRVKVMEASASWRIATPLRWLKSKLRGGD